MTDFLTNLLMRSGIDQPAVSVLQPRLPALFEPQGSTEEKQLAILEDSMQETIFPARDLSARQRGGDQLSNNFFNAFSNYRSVPDDHVAESIPSLGERTKERVSDTRRVHAESAPEANNEKPQQTIIPHSPHEVLNIPTLTIHPNLNQKSETGDLGRHVELRSLPKPKVQDDAIPGAERRVPVRTLKAGIDQEISTESTKSPATKDSSEQQGIKPMVMQKPLELPVHLREGWQFRTSHAPDPPQVIEVHIGRIEVRATPPATPSKRSPQTAAKTSLDDYLRARSGEKR